MSLARFSVRNPVPVNLLMLAIIFVGAMSFARLPRELMSEISFNWVFITTPYPGVAAEEIERLITVPIEDEIRDVQGIESITSQSVEGASFISVKFEQMSDAEFRARLQDLRSEIEKVQDLPEDALETDAQAFGSADFGPLVSVHLTGGVSERRLVELARLLRESLRQVNDVAKVELVGARDREIWVEADPAALQAYGLSPLALQAAIARHGVNVPAGRLSLGRRELLVRSLGEFRSADEVRRVIVRTTADGRKLRVADLATVDDTFAIATTRNRLNGELVMSLAVTKRKTGNSIAIIDEVKQVAKAFETRYASEVHVAFTQDSSELIRDILTKLSNNALLGFTIVILLLMVVLGLRNAILAGLGIPISFLATFTFMHYTGETLNGNSLFGLVLVLGILVDDAIVVAENCHRHLQMGKSWKDAAIDGSQEVFRPVLSATLTTIAAFSPLILLPGIMGKFMRIIPLTVSLALVASLVEAFIILPSHFADWPGRHRDEGRLEAHWMDRARARYAVWLKAAVKRRKWVVGSMFLVVVLAAGLVPLVGVELFAGEDINIFQVRVTMPTGTNLDTTLATLSELEAAATGMPKGEVRNVQTTAGLLMTEDDWVMRTDVGQLWVDLSMSYDRERTADAIIADLRSRVDEVAGPLRLEFVKLQGGPPVGKPVEVKLKGKYLDELARAAADLEQFLASIDGVHSVGNDLRAGTEELRVRIDPERAALHNLGIAEVGWNLRAAVDGVDAAKVYDGDEEIDVVVRVRRDAFTQTSDLLRLPVLLPSGASITLGDLATLERASSYAAIRRYNNQRAITVFGDIEKTKTSAVKVNRMIGDHFEKSMQARYPGISLDFSGEFQEFKEAFSSLGQLFLVGILLVYLILGAQFHSYLQPVVILLTVPFAFLGAIFGLLLSGNPFSITTLFGMVALGGVAVNDAIVLISFLNDLRGRGVDAEEAAVEAGSLRLRPVILTSVTTVAGLLPMAMGLGGMSLTWGPLANTIVWGLVVATLLTLFVIPCAYLVLVVDIPRRLRRKAASADA